MGADVGIHERWNLIVFFEKYAPKIRKRNDGVEVDFKTTSDIFKKRLVLHIYLSFVNSYFNMVFRSLMFLNILITKKILFFVVCIFNMSHKSFVLSTNATHILKNSSRTILFLLECFLSKFRQIYLIRQLNIQPIDILPELQNQVIWEVDVAVKLFQHFIAFLAMKTTLLQFLY